jgi:hypothetical protein
MGRAKGAVLCCFVASLRFSAQGQAAAWRGTKQTCPPPPPWFVQGALKKSKLITQSVHLLLLLLPLYLVWFCRLRYYAAAK